jgi:hypothetical protein
MNIKRVAIVVAVALAVVWGVVFAVKAVRSAFRPAAVVATVVEQVAKVEVPYTVTKTAPAFTAPAPVCTVDPKLLPKKVQPKTKIAPAAPQPKPRPTAAYHKVIGQPVLLPN